MAKDVGGNCGVALDIFHMNIEEADWRAGDPRHRRPPRRLPRRRQQPHAAGPGRDRLGGARAASWPAIGYDEYLTVEFVATVDRSPLSQRTEIADASEAGASQGMEQFLRDHGTGALPEHYYDEYVQDSIDRLRKARRRRSAPRPRTPWPPARHRADRHPRHQGGGDRLRARPAARARRAAGRDRHGHPRRAARAASPTCRPAEVAAAAGDDLAAIRAAGSRGAAVERMLAGVRAVCVRLYAEGRLDGALCLGGAEGGLMGAGAMHALPVGVPKLIVTPSASGRRAFAPVHGRDRHAGHALRRRHPRPAPDLARDLRQRGGRRGRAWRATAAAPSARSARARSA